MKNLTHPNFIIGAISLVLLIVGVGMYANGFQSSFYVWVFAFLLGGIHWVWSIVDVLKHYRTNAPSENLSIFWVIMVLIVPPVGGLMYYALGRRIEI